MQFSGLLNCADVGKLMNAQPYFNIPCETHSALASLGKLLGSAQSATSRGPSLTFKNKYYPLSLLEMGIDSCHAPWLLPKPRQWDGLDRDPQITVGWGLWFQLLISPERVTALVHFTASFPIEPEVTPHKAWLGWCSSPCLEKQM